VEGNVMVTSTEEGAVYLVPGGTVSELVAIMQASIDSADVLAGIAVEIPVTGLDNGIYWFYARDTAFNLSEPEELTVHGVGIRGDRMPRTRIFPNPMTQSALLEITLVESGPLMFTLFDSRGDLVREEFLGHYAVGRQQVVIRRNGLPGGLYLFRIEGSRGTLSGGRVVIGN